MSAAVVARPRSHAKEKRPSRREIVARTFKPDARLFRACHAALFLGLPTTTFYRTRKEPGFPKPRLVGLYSLIPMYSREDLEAWVRALPAGPADAASTE